LREFINCAKYIECVWRIFLFYWNCEMLFRFRTGFKFLFSDGKTSARISACMSLYFS
jgi:hypothetical protein